MKVKIVNYSKTNIRSNRIVVKPITVQLIVFGMIFLTIIALIAMNSSLYLQTQEIISLKKQFDSAKSNHSDLLEKSAELATLSRVEEYLKNHQELRQTSQSDKALS